MGHPPAPSLIVATVATVTATAQGAGQLLQTDREAKG